MNSKVDKYLLDGCMRCKYGGTPQCKVHTWQYELDLLRSILLQTPLVEEIKWGVPTYTHKGKNVVLICAFKHYCCISFFKGVLIPDKYQLFTKRVNSTSDRIISFTYVQQIEDIQNQILEYIYNAIEIEESDKKVVFERNEPIPSEFIEICNDDSQLQQAFNLLTKGRQRAYILYFSQAKQSKTRIQRIEKYREKILAGLGLHDRYL